MTSTTTSSAVPRVRTRSIEVSNLLIWLILAVLVAVNLWFQPNFLDLSNLQFVFSSSLVLLFAAAAAGYVMLIAEIDLSLGAVMTLVNVLIATVAPDNAALAVVLAVAVGIGCGLVSGALVAFIRLPSIIVTLAMSTVWGGIALFIMSRPGGSVPLEFSGWMYSALPMVATAVLAVASIWLARTPAGRNIYGLGSDELGAFLSRISLPGTKLLVFGIAGLLLGLGGVALSGITSVGDPLAGQSYTLKAITAAVLGGISFAGGRGLIAGALAGALALTLITNVTQFAGVSSFYQGIVDGGLLILSLALSRVVTGKWINVGLPSFRKDAK
jgi:ribose transport system permease protein